MLDLGGFNQEIGSLAGAGTVTNSGPTASAPAILTAGGDNTSTIFSGTIQDGPTTNTTALTKTGTGTLTLTGANTYTGDTTIDAGTLEIGGAGALGTENPGNNYAGNIINDGTFEYSSSANQTLSGVISGTGQLIKDTSRRRC